MKRSSEYEVLPSHSRASARNYTLVNLLVLPGLVDTPLTRNPARWSALISEVTANENPPKNPTERETWSTRAPHIPLRVAWLKPPNYWRTSSAA